MSRFTVQPMFFKVLGLVLLAFALLVVPGWNVPVAQGASTRIDTEFLTTKPSVPNSQVTRSGKGYRFDSNGWIYVHIEGEPYERGYQHGFLTAKELATILRSLKDLTLTENGMDWAYFVNAAETVLVPDIPAEYLDEMKGIADGAKAAGTDMTWQEVVAWNGYVELTDYWFPNQEAGTLQKGTPGRRSHCTAFIATGSYTADGKIVMAHTTWDLYQWGQFFNEILDIQPLSGHRMFMQTAPGYIDSFTDFFVTDAGMMGTETTIAGFDGYALDGIPEFVRIRKAMQYADTLDQLVETMKDGNNGGYANSWLFGDKNTGEIMLYEQGLKYVNVQRTKDGYFIGFNAASDPQLRNLEAPNSGWYDTRWATGARRVRLTQLMEQYKGKLNAELGEQILGDHYDVYLDKENPSSRTIEGHYELDPMQYWAEREPYTPHGAVDGKVMTSDMANDMSFVARWGNASGMPFDAQAFLKEHIQWDYLDGYMADRPTQPWQSFKAGENPESSAAPRLTPELRTALDAAINKFIADNNLPGAVVSIEIPNEPEYVYVGGKANLETGRARELADPIRIASITKTFVGLATLILVDEGKLSLTDTLSKWYPDFPNADKITIDDLLRMRSGIPDAFDEEMAKQYFDNPTIVFGPDDMIARSAAKAIDFKPPNTETFYSNVNTIILGRILEKVTGKPLDVLLVDSIMKPLRLNDTFYPTDNTLPGELHGYSWDTATNAYVDKTTLNPGVAGGAGAIISTVADLKRYVRALCNGVLLKPETHAAQLQGETLAGSPDWVKYGENIALFGKFCGHTGTIYGFSTDAFYLPDLDATVVVSVNRLDLDDHSFSTPLDLEVSKMVFPEYVSY